MIKFNTPPSPPSLAPSNDTLPEFNEFKPRLKSRKNRFSIERRLKFDTIIQSYNWAAAKIL